MKRILLTSLFGILFSFIASAQVDTVYLERFDPPSGPDSVSTYNTNSLLNSHWNDTTNLWQSSTSSFHTRIVSFDSVIFETDTFSTVGNVFVRLSFNHIAKIHFGQRGYLQASNDNGATWTTLTGTMYQGNSPQFAATGYFNELSYPSSQQVPYWYGPTVSAGNVTNPTNNWWAEEKFDVSTILGGTNGYPKCKIRFIAAYQTQAPVTLSGWYVDDLLVEAAPCELEPPTFTYNVIPYRKPNGARYTSNQAVNIRARDAASGVDSLLVHWRLNGGAWQVDQMTTTTSTSCPDSAEYTHTWTNIALYDTIDWYIEIFDCACPNITRDPIATANPDYYTFWRDPSPPEICGTTLPNSFPNIVSLFPWTEDFEDTKFVAGTGTGNTGTAHRGTWPGGNPPSGLNWKVDPGETDGGFAWSIRVGGTGTANTGPSGNHTVGGSKYIYTEASQGNGSGTPVFTQAITPCIDLTNVNCAALEFYYHMYGANIDRIRIDVDTGTTTNAYVNGVALLKNQQQISDNDPYKRAYISLEQFSGKIIRIRFVGRKNTSVSQDKNDMAIDDITILEPEPVDVEMTNYSLPLNGYCSYSSTETVAGALRSLGCQTLSAIPIACKIEYTTTGGTTSTTIIRDTLLGSYGLGSDTAFTFSPTADLSGYGTYKLWIYSEVPGDTTNSNDTVGPYNIEHRQPVTSFPMLMDFDGSGTTAGDGTCNNPGVTGTTDWERIPDPSNCGFAFHVGDDKTPSYATGPRNDHSWDGNYLYTEGNYGTAPVSATFTSKCLDLTNMTYPVIEFMYHMYGSDVGALAVQIVPAGSNTWTNMPNAIINTTSQFQTQSIDPWKYFRVGLNSYAGQVVKLRLISQKSGNGDAADIAVDNLRIYDRIANDVGIMFIKRPSQRVDTTGPVTPNFVIRNYGTTSVSNIPITYTITPLCGPNAGVPTTYTTTYTGTIGINSEVEYILPASQMPNYPVGSFEICAETNLTGDTHSWNDSYCRESVGWPLQYIQTGFFEDFDGCTEANESGFWINGTYRTFAVGSVQKSSNPQSFSTYEFDYNSYPNTNEELYAPKFQGFDTIVGAQLWFKHKFNFGSADAGIVEVFLNGNWLPLGFQDPDDEIGLNWFNGANIPAANNGSAFVGSTNSWPGNTNGWITSMWPLNIYNFSINPLILRWNMLSPGGGSQGWAIDDVEVRIPPQNSASPFEVDVKEFPPFPGIPATVQVRIQNTGAKRLDSCMITYEIDNSGVWSTPEKVVFNPKLLAKGKTQYIDFVTKWQNPTSGTHTVCVATFGPNGKQDNYTPDDTLCVTIKILDEFIFTATDTSYCNGFDDPTQVEWIEKNTYNKKGLVSWEKGTPNQAPIVGAHSAPNAWMTKLNNNYKLRDSSSLYTPVFVCDSGQVYEINFWHNFKTELYHDGGTVDISFDGLSWRTVGYVLKDSSWYNIDHVTSLNILDPGWSGESGGWIQSHIKIQFDQDRKCVLRFRFGSDQSFEYQGWAIDDFCMNASSGIPDDFIGISELNESDYIDVGNIIPNPSNGFTRIPYYLSTASDVKVSVYNTIGQQMIDFVQPSAHGVNSIEFDVTGWAPGLYIVAIDVNGERVTRKLMVR